MSPQKFVTLWCLVEGDPQPYDVYGISPDVSVSQLKRKIQKRIEYLNGSGNSDRLKLLKLDITVPIDPDHDLAQRLEKLGNIDTYSTALSSGQTVMGLFPGLPGTNSPNLHIVVRRPQEIALPSPITPPDRQFQTECLHESLLPSEVKLTNFHLALQVINASPGWYSNFHNLGSLPFPMLYSRLPIERFSLSKTTDQESVKMFEYMGRERFSHLWNEVEAFQRSGQLFLHGNMGSGKSHMLAALACLLFRLGERPVYLPDCWQMLAHPLLYLQSAMLFSFADLSSSSLARRNEIRSFQRIEDALKFCGNLGETRLYFIVDQVNALEHEEINADLVSNSRKEELSAFLQKITVGHHCITSASANYRTFQSMAKKQTGEIKMSMMGGMSKAEMKQWWVHYKDELPIFERETDKGRVEDLTGRIPLLLRPLSKWKGEKFCDVEQKFWQHRELTTVIRQPSRKMIESARQNELEIVGEEATKELFKNTGEGSSKRKRTPSSSRPKTRSNRKARQR